MTVEELRGVVTVGEDAVLGQGCVLGCPKEARLRAAQVDPASAGTAEPVTIGQRCLVFNHVVLYEGVRVGDDCVLEDRVRVGYDGWIGAHSRLVYGAYVCDRVRIGSEARVAGFVCDASVIGPRSTVMGHLVHEYTRPHEDWWQVDEPSPVVESDSVVGYGARVVGGVCIGPRSYVAAGAVVTKTVPPEHIVTGVNRQTPIRDWPGEKLQSWIEHWTRAGHR